MGHFSALLDAEAFQGHRVPVTLLTGFLGSGKTTLLNRLLALPDMAGTAVIVNEFGAIGIDHDLVASSTEDTVLLANGCLCCAMRGDLAEALDALAARADPAIGRVLIESSGLADPGPILRTVMGETSVRKRYRLAGVACTVDVVQAASTLDRHPEAARQIAVADDLFLTKVDLLDTGLPQDLLDRLRSINPDAALRAETVLHPQQLKDLVERPDDPSIESGDGTAHYRPSGRSDSPPHRDGISTFHLTREQPLPRAAFSAWLDLVIAMRGEDLLRVKGIVHLVEQPDRPLVFHGVQHLFEEPRSLSCWPSADRRTRIVFITKGLDPEPLADTLDVMVRGHLRRQAASRP